MLKIRRYFLKIKNQLLTKDNFVKLKTDKSKLKPISIPERKNKLSEKKSDLKYVQTLDQSTRTSLSEVKLSASTPTRPENKIVVAIKLDLDIWGENLFGGIQMDEETPKCVFRSVFKFRESNDDFLLF